MIVMKSRRLRVSVEDPLSVRKRTKRFDPCGFVREVLLDDNILFTSTEPYSRAAGSTGGAGLCSAFEPVVPDSGASGTAGNKSKAPFAADIPDISTPPEYEITVIPSASGAYEVRPGSELVLDNMEVLNFRTKSVPFGDGTAEITRSLRVDGSCLHMTMKFRNTGDRPAAFREYCHNFLSMDGMSLGPDWKLSLPFASSLKESMKTGVGAEGFYLLDEEGRSIVPAESRPDFSVFEIAEDELDKGSVLNPFCWTLSHRDAGIHITGTEYYEPAGITVWARDHVITPEVHFGTEVMPGQTVSWGRKWEFCNDRG